MLVLLVAHPQHSMICSWARTRLASHASLVATVRLRLVHGAAHCPPPRHAYFVARWCSAECEGGQQSQDHPVGTLVQLAVMAQPPKAAVTRRRLRKGFLFNNGPRRANPERLDEAVLQQQCATQLPGHGKPIRHDDGSFLARTQQPSCSGTSSPAAAASASPPYHWPTRIASHPQSSIKE